MTGRSQSWAVHDSMSGWMRDKEKRIYTEERRPVIRHASDLLGPGIAQYAVPIADWAQEETASNGIFVSAPSGSIDNGSPDSTQQWIGISYATEDGNGFQQVWVDPGGSPSYVRTWTTDPNETRSFTAWVPSGGGGSSTPSGPAGGDLTGAYPDPQIAAGAVGNAELAANAVTTDKIADGTISAADLSASAISSLRPEVKDEGVQVGTDISIFDFVGAGVSVTETPDGTAVVTIPGGGGGAGPMLTWQVNATADTTLTTNVDQPICSVTITSTSTSDKFLIVGTMDVRNNTANTQTMIGTLLVDGVTTFTPQQFIALSGGVALWRATIHQNYLLTGLSSGTHTLQLVARTTAATGGTWVVVQSHTRFTVTKLEGPVGPAGPSGGAFSFVQGAAASTWVIDHPLGFRPNVTTVDSTGRQVEGDVVYTDADTVTITFSGAFAGTAYLS